MAKRLVSKDIEWTVLDEFNFIDAKELLKVEGEWIAKMDPLRNFNTKA